MISPTECPKWILKAMNQLFALKAKAKRKEFYDVIEREIEIMERQFADYGLVLHDPLGEKCPDTRTDVEVNIAGESIENLVVVEVIKPIIRLTANDDSISISTVVQKGAVVAESQPS